MTTSVSIPFIAGQWSLPPRPGPAIRRARVSIPFIAGQWSLPERARRLQNQLEVSIPFIAGQWSLLKEVNYELTLNEVSIPFIAGQWSLPYGEGGRVLGGAAGSQSPSLRGSGRFPEAAAADCARLAGLNPLHCGAVVASTSGDRATRSLLAGLNPLHCGAVVASSASTRE